MKYHLDSILNWMHLNYFEINSSKSKAIDFYLYTQFFTYHRICMGNQLISYVDSLNCLGVIIDSNLSFEEHINFISSQVSFILRRLYAVKPYTPSHVRLRLAHALIMSKLNYCLEVYFGSSPVNLSYLEKIFWKNCSLYI